MSWSSAIGWMVAGAAVLAAVLLRSPLDAFVNGPSLVLVVGGTCCLLLFTHGGDALWTHGIGGLGRWLQPDRFDGWHLEDHLKTTRIANSAGILAILMGALSTLIGCVQMLQKLDDPRQIGPALAVALLSVFYAVALNALLFFPLARHHLAAAGGLQAVDAQRPDPASPLMKALLVLGLLGLSVGCTFLLLLLAMGSWGQG